MVASVGKKRSGLSKCGGTVGTNPKRAKPLSHQDGSRRILRSMSMGKHPLIVGVATMQVESLSDFELAAPPLSAPSSQSSSGVVNLVDGSSTFAADASDSSILEIWSPVAQYSQPTFTLASQESPPSTIAASSQDSIIATWSPSPPVAPQTPTPVRAPRTPPGEVPWWFEEVYDSEGYTSDALRLIEGLRPSTQRRPRLTAPPTTPEVPSRSPMQRATPSSSATLLGEPSPTNSRPSINAHVSVPASSPTTNVESAIHRSSGGDTTVVGGESRCFMC
ncbi:hypothetical protein PR003_g6580 [Phytophthora rubi]|uniref:Uncharacterized protein n=1 Tax=Phytophthora rubi TaxID=129364 RepID=A0A6A4G204_9STRA|nr:hypothetical protein PR003_g6580 [Phytophthora rubi]